MLKPLNKSPAIGGSTLFNMGHYFLWLGLAFLASISLVATRDSITTLSLWAAAHLVGFTGAALWLLLFHSVMFKKRTIEPIRNIWVYLFGFFLGLIKGACTGIASNALHLESSSAGEVLLRGVSAGLISCLTVPALAFVEFRRRQYQRDLDLLVARQIREELDVSELALEKPFEGAQLDNLRNRLDSLLEQVSKTERFSELQRNLPHVIREIAEGAVRPLSHRIWAIQAQERNDFSLRTLAKVAFAAKPKPLSIYLTVFFTVVFFGYQLEYSIVVSFLSSVIGTGILAATSLVAGWLNPKKLKVRIVTEIFCLGIAVMLINLVNRLLFSSSMAPGSFDSTVALLIWLLELRFIFGVFAAATEAHSSIQTQLESAVSNNQRQTLAEEALGRLKNRNLANLLHGQVQNGLLGTSLKLESGSVSKLELQADIEALIELLKSPATTDLTGRDKTDQFSTGIIRIQNRWAGFATITITVNESGHGNKPLNESLLLELLEEAIANAVRHGLADVIHISLESRDGAGQEITVLDNGVGPRDGKSGLGTALFETVSLGDWELSPRANGGTQLRVVIRPWIQQSGQGQQL